MRVKLRHHSPQRMVFKAGELHGNVVLNFGNSPEDELAPYAGAFHEAAQVLVHKMEISHGYSDLDACPIVFLYRHALELYCKAIVLAGNDLMRILGKKCPIASNAIWHHKIGTLLPAMGEIFRAVNWEWEKGLGGFDSFQQLKTFISEIESIDPNSDAFRYPIKRTGEATMPKNFLFNVIDYAEKMDKLLDLLDGAAMGIGAMFDDICAAQ